jgi:hypothetical protein
MTPGLFAAKRRLESRSTKRGPKNVAISPLSDPPNKMWQVKRRSSERSTASGKAGSRNSIILCSRKSLCEETKLWDARGSFNSKPRRKRIGFACKASSAVFNSPIIRDTQVFRSGQYGFRWGVGQMEEIYEYER